MGSPVDITSSFIEGAPPSELQDVVKDIKALTSDDDPALIAKLKPAFQKYNEEQMTAVKLPGGSDHVCTTQYIIQNTEYRIHTMHSNDNNQLTSMPQHRS
jgi:capping protein alpha